MYRQKIAWFRKKLKPLIEEKTKEGYAVAMQDEAIVIAEARARRGIYTPMRGVYTYTGSHSKTIVITTDGRGYFERYSSFTKEEFVKFLKAVHAKFGKILIILDGAAQHRAKCVKEELKKLVGLELKFLPPGCPDLNAIEEVWRQMKHAVLDSTSHSARCAATLTVYTLGAKNCVERMEQTVGTYPDYRGIQILGATYCADGFVLLAEIDEEEMLEPVQVLQESMLVIGSAIVPAMATVAFVISRKISGPIVRLRDAANQIESGRLDVVTGINSADEVGQLSSAFDSMAGRLRKQAAAIRQKEDVIRYEEGILLKF